MLLEKQCYRTHIMTKVHPLKLDKILKNILKN